jgi:hypothetical protein
MIEVTIRTDNELALQKLLDFISTLGFQVVGKKQVRNGKGKAKAVKAEEQDLSELPIVWAAEPDVMALAGIWEGQKIDPEQLRNDAWGGRL